MMHNIWLKDSFIEAKRAFKLGPQCYYCNYENVDIACDMVRDVICKINIVQRFFFAIKILIQVLINEVKDER